MAVELDARNAVTRMFAQFERDPTPDWDTLYIGVDALMDAGEERLAEVAGWMVAESSWPQRMPSGWYWYSSEPRTGRGDGCIGECLWRAIFEGVKQYPFFTFRDAMHALSTALYLQSFEADSTPNYATASECADWLESHERRPELVKGIRWMCEKGKWPKKICNPLPPYRGVANAPHYTAWGDTWSDAVEAIGRAV